MFKVCQLSIFFIFGKTETHPYLQNSRLYEIENPLFCFYVNLTINLN